MLTRMLIARRTAKVLVAILLLSMLVACGKATSSPSGATFSQQKPDLSIPTSASRKRIDFTIANINIYSGIGINCLNYGTTNKNDPDSLTANLVLATDRLTYDTSELQQMRTYAAAIYSGHPATIPSTLKLVQGTMASNSPFFTFTNLVGGGCYGEMELTNLGKDVILIRSVNMHLTAVPQKTSRFQYRMIDICSLIGNSGTGCPPGAGGGAPVIDSFLLKAAPSGTLFTPQVQSIYDPQDQSGSDIILNPNAQYTVPVLFYFTSSDKLVYSLTPELLLDTPNNPLQAVALPQLATTLYFADHNQFSCYTLQGDTFVQYKEDNNNQYCL